MGTERENIETFLARLRAVFTEYEVHRIHNAYDIAKHAFASKVRKERDPFGRPVRYFEHLRHVAIILIEMGCRDFEEVIAGLLHDLLEDTRLDVAYVEANYGPKVARRVSQVSKVPKDGYHHRLVTFGTWETFRLKAADRLHNLRTLEAGSLEFRAKQIAETEVDYLPLFDRMVDECPPAERANMERLRRAVRDELDRQRDLLARASAATA